jgi:hypothetical protein
VLGAYFRKMNTEVRVDAIAFHDGVSRHGLEVPSPLHPTKGYHLSIDFLSNDRHLIFFKY